MILAIDFKFISLRMLLSIPSFFRGVFLIGIELEFLFIFAYIDKIIWFSFFRLLIEYITLILSIKSICILEINLFIIILFCVLKSSLSNIHTAMSASSGLVLTWNIILYPFNFNLFDLYI